MFTGIVEEVGIVAACGEYGLTVSASQVMGDLKLGDSIAVNGTCLDGGGAGRGAVPG